MKKPPSILVLADLRRPRVAEAVAEVRRFLMGRAEVRVRDLCKGREERRVSAAFAVTLGGDGAILAAGRRLAASRIPILGVNLGKLGFLTEIGRPELEAALGTLLLRPPRVVERMMLQTEVRRRGRIVRRCTAVNDVVISRAELSRIVEITLYLDGRKVNTFTGDGLICATPIGSTAHSLSAGGPILAPDTRAVVITPICPHTLSNRPLVVDEDTVVEVRASAQDGACALTADGQVLVTLQKNDRIRVRKCARPLRLIKATKRSFFETLHTKLRWEGSVSHAWCNVS